jgi:putative molybdopterin biosynthesis protein
VVTEQYDLIIPNGHYHSQNLQILLEIINSQAFKQRVEALGGYSTQNTGKVIDIN